MQETKGAALVPTRVPIIGTKKEISTALALQNRRQRLLTDPATIKPVRVFNRPGEWREQWRVDVDLLMPPPAPAPPPPPAKKVPTYTPPDSVGAAMAKALGFVGAVFALLVGTGFVLYLLTRDLIHREHLIGAVVFLVAGLLLAGNRINHSGACPGVAVHCKGCRH